ncbi:MAG: hypothetical protein P4L34_02000 [Paludibacter sp.]|nr:hypothetical protein [Paludibacter sp.]
MTRKSINLLNMLKSVVQFYDENPNLLTDKPALQAAVEKLKAFIHQVEQLEQEQGKNTKTYTALKGETKVTLINAIQKVLAGVAAHAAATNDTSLKMESDFTDYELKKMRDNSLILEAHAAHELAVNIAAELETWNVTQADIDAIDTNSAAFDAKDPAIKNIKARTAQATADIKATLNEAYTFTKDTLDAMMLPLKMQDTTVYGHYQKARTIINTAGAHSKATATDASAAVK